MMHNQNMIHEGPVIYHNGCINKDITHETIVFYHDDLTELFQNKSLLEPFSQGLKKQDSLKYQNKHLLQGLLEVLLAQTNLKTIDPSDFPQQHPTHLHHLHPSPIHHLDDTSGKTGL